ncbi:hypothetical protein MLD38_024698 [Melastoma candidum]|uniref:Uncharacterized protein n=1 Tax=Melastoma candidum TaxID=119954 RepID=A0ACB9NY68_9MYRT|nr:hypothetical protein MLD38_024698 [Melastoma candidum]
MGRAPCCDKANVKKGPWSPEEDAKLKSYILKHGTGGNWIALPQKIGLRRCGKSCRLRWLNYLRPNIKHGDFSEEEDNLICSMYISIGSRWSIIAAQLPGRTDNDIKNYWNTKLKKKLLGDQKKGRVDKRGRGNNPNREMEKRVVGGFNYLMTDNMDIGNCGSSSQRMSYCPAMALPMSTLLQQPMQYNNHELPHPSNFDDHTLIRKLLIKLGGRFYDENDHHAVSDRFPDITDGSSSRNPGHEQLVNDRAASPIPMSHLLQSDSHFTLGLNANNGYSKEGLEGLEFLLGYDETIVRDSAGLLAGVYGGRGGPSDGTR